MIAAVAVTATVVAAPVSHAADPFCTVQGPSATTPEQNFFVGTTYRTTQVVSAGACRGSALIYTMTMTTRVYRVEPTGSVIECSSTARTMAVGGAGAIRDTVTCQHPPMSAHHCYRATTTLTTSVNASVWTYKQPQFC